jgi:hypothetical protein
MRIRELDDITAQATFTDSDGKKHCVNASGGVAATLRREWAKCRRELRKEERA